MNILPITALLFFLLPSLPPSELDQTINALQTKYLRLNTLTADFTQIYNSPGERMRRESGRLQLKKPGKMRWDYAAPEAKLYVSDGRLIYEYIPADRIATRTSVKDSGDLRAPFMFFAGAREIASGFQPH